MKQEAQPTGSAPQDQRQPQASATPITSKAQAVDALTWLCQELRNQALFLGGLDLATGSALNLEALSAFAAEMRKAADTAKAFTDFAINTGAAKFALAAAQQISDEADDTSTAINALMEARNAGSFASQPEAPAMILDYFLNFGAILANRRALLQWLKIEAPSLLQDQPQAQPDQSPAPCMDQRPAAGSQPTGSAASPSNGEASGAPVRSTDTVSRISPSQPTGSAPQDQPAAQPIAQQWKTKKAKKLLAEAVEAGLCERSGSKYKWIQSAALYGYFVDLVSTYLDLRPSNKRLPWAKFSALFSGVNLRTAQSAVNDYTNNCLPKPEGFEKIQALCQE